MKKRDKKQDIAIVNARWLDIWERVAIFLHIVILFLGALSLIVFFTSVEIGDQMHWITTLSEILETLTLIVIIIIILETFTKENIKRYVVSKGLHVFWGEKKYVQLELIIPQGTDVNIFNPSIPSYKINSYDKYIIHDINIEFMWVKSGLFGRHLTYTMDFDDPNFNFEGMEGMATLTRDYKPTYVKYDAKSRILDIDVSVKIHPDFNDGNISRFYFVFNTNLKTCDWSGVFPNTPCYGKWKLKNTQVPNVKVDFEKVRKGKKEVFKII